MRLSLASDHHAHPQPAEASRRNEWRAGIICYTRTEARRAVIIHTTYV